jgi:hypothetical protein
MEANVAHNLFGSVRDYAANDAVPRNRVDAVTSTVFIIEDDTSVRESLELLIRTAGWEPQSFASAEEFLAHPRETLPCCLIVDLTSRIERSRIAEAARWTSGHANDLRQHTRSTRKLRRESREMKTMAPCTAGASLALSVYLTRPGRRDFWSFAGRRQANS